ncbi:hypothetical protein [Neobacillus mesonae]|uniref:hypothetical protein n=1 Tax=Neobacillus mesonae TaxID=1193713 RepID=UPI002040C773|nr:hypothetical protein [Neobacillus mesonae]MCM3569331.1 hypothetical protein [Neobacillus mesonae]
MKKGNIIVTLMLLFALAACSSETAKVEQNGEGKKVSANENKKSVENVPEKMSVKKVDSQKYSFEEFRQLNEKEQKEYMVPLVNNLGYTDDLANWILSLINDTNTQIPSSVQTVGDYAEFYVNNAEIQDGYKLDWKLKEEKKLAKSGNQEDDYVTIDGPGTFEPIKIAKETVNKRIDAIKKEPLLKIKPTGEFSLLGICVGYSFDYVKGLLGEPDKTGVIEGGNNHFYYIPANTLHEGMDFYTLIISVVDGDTIKDVHLEMNYKEEAARSMEIPKEFSDKFDGELLTTNYTDKSYEYWSDFSMLFLRNIPGRTDALKIRPAGENHHHYYIDLQIWNDTEWKVFDTHTRKGLFKNIPLEEAQKILRGPKAAGIGKK